jgi:hypothetical protein
VAAIATAHGGAVDIANSSTGSGAVVRLYLPISPATGGE